MELSDFIFKDLKDCEWDLKITLGTAQRIDKADFMQLTGLEFSFINPEKDLFSEIFVNTPFAMALVWVIIQDQIEENLVRAKSEDYFKGLDTAEGDNRRQEIIDYMNELQADESIDWELEFINRLDGDALEAARQALLRALADFFPLHRIVLLKFLQQIEKTRAMTNLEMERLMPMMEKQVASQVKEVFDEARRKLEEGDLSSIVGKT